MSGGRIRVTQVGTINFDAEGYAHIHGWRMFATLPHTTDKQLSCVIGWLVDEVSGAHETPVSMFVEREAELKTRELIAAAMEKSRGKL